MKPSKPLKQQLAESNAMQSARKGAEQTPQEVREAFLARRRQIGPVWIEPFSLGQLWLFESLKHPFNEGAELIEVDGKQVPKRLSMCDTARAIFVFHDAESANEALQGGLEQFDAEALALASGIDPALLPEITSLIAKTFTEGLATIPGAGGSNPRATGC